MAVTFDFAKMSPDEKQFIRTYCFALQRDYDMLQIIRGLMSPAGLHVVCAVMAAKHALQLRKMQQTFCKKIETVGVKFRVGKAEPKDELATPEQIATIFTQSFFKLVDSDTKKALVTDKNLPDHDGWSSGHPFDWQQTLKSLQEIQTQQLKEKLPGHNAIINALLNLFDILPNKLSKQKWEEEEQWDDDYYEDDDDDPGFDFLM